jgi:hypothetical protein
MINSTWIRTKEENLMRIHVDPNPNIVARYSTPLHLSFLSEGNSYFTSIFTL